MFIIHKDLLQMLHGCMLDDKVSRLLLYSSFGLQNL